MTPGSAPLRPAIFLDRDGTINEDVEYLSRPEDLRLLPGVGAALRRLQEQYELIVITNQSGIARGYFDEQRLQEIHRRLDELLAAYEVRISRYYYCPHHPDFKDSPYGIDCLCRKPQPLLYRRAIADFHIDAASSWAVGDRLRDCLGAIQLGCRGIVICGDSARRDEVRRSCPLILTAADFTEAAQIILSSDTKLFSRP